MSRRPWSSEDLVAATGGKSSSRGQGNSFSGISIDSRRVSPDELFLAFEGEVHDGHSFIGDVLQKGVKGLIVSWKTADDPEFRRRISKDISVVAVEDTNRALMHLGSYHRRRADIPVIAITGSNGKTTTRSMTVSIVSRRFNTLSSKKNFNNAVGVPLTLLDIDTAHQAAVLELGMNHPGEIAVLTEIAAPDIGAITNVGPAHLEGVGSIEGVMRAKGELLEKLGDSGKAVLNADDAMIRRLALETGYSPDSGKSLFFGLAEDAHVRAENIETTLNGLRFRMILPESRFHVNMKVNGEFMIHNALAAAASACLLNIDSEDIKSGLESWTPVKGRMNILKPPCGVNMIDDTYNANPGSMKAALATLKQLAGDARTIFAAGEMFELGNHSAALHREVGRFAALSGVSRFYATGRYMNEFARGAVEGHMAASDIMTGEKENIIKDLAAFARPGDWVLVKGSRAMKMEIIIQGVLDVWNAESTDMERPE